MGCPAAPEHLQGKSLRSRIEGADLEPSDVFIEWNGHNNGFGDLLGKVSIPEALRGLASEEAMIAAITDPVRTVITRDGKKLNYSLRGEHELYDLEHDPFETCNLAAQPGMGALIETLGHKIEQWQKWTGDTV
jgi:hypothetical protein